MTTKQEQLSDELRNLSTVSEYMHGGLSDASKVTKSYYIMLNQFSQQGIFQTNLSYLLTQDLKEAFKKIDGNLKPDLSNIDDPVLNKALAGTAPSGAAGKITNMADLITTLLPADGKLDLDSATKVEAYKYLVNATVTDADDKQAKISAVEDALKNGDIAFIDGKYGAVVNVLFGSADNHKAALEKMAVHPGLHCTGCEIQQNMDAVDAKAPAELLQQFDKANRPGFEIK